MLRDAAEASARFEDRKIVFTWCNNSVYTDPGKMIFPRVSDPVMLLAYHVKHPDVAIVRSGAKRSVGYEALKIPSYRSGKWHTWKALISDDRENISNSEYLGIVNVPETDPGK